MKTIKNSVLEMAEQIKAGMKITEDGLIEAAELPIPPVIRQQVTAAAVARALQTSFSPQFIDGIRQEVARYLRGTYVLKHKGSPKRRHKLRNDGTYIQIMPMASEAQRKLDAAYDEVMKKRGLLRMALFGDEHIGSASPTRDQIAGGHVSQIPVSKE